MRKQVCGLFGKPKLLNRAMGLLLLLPAAFRRTGSGLSFYWRYGHGPSQQLQIQAAFRKKEDLVKIWRLNLDPPGHF